MNKIIRTVISLSLPVALALSAASPAVHAHGGAKAQYGGIVQTAKDLSFELVGQSSSTALYVVDHGKPADAGKFSGKLTVLNGASKAEAELKPAGGNKLEAPLLLEKGAKAVATIKLPDGTSTAVRFSIK